MRFLSFTIEQYGAMQERRIDFGDGTGLTVIHGRNEAGKSTCRSAITDFLFGIDPRSRYGDKQTYSRMRLRADLAFSDGSTASFTRRKGQRGRTLLGPDEEEIDESRLAMRLGATTQERFEMLFALDHEILRDGGEALLRADGDIGRMIVEAGGGLRSLMPKIEDLKARSDALFTPNRSKDRAFYQALDAFTAAQSEIKAHLLTRENFDEATKALAGAEDHLRTVRQTLADKRREQERWGRRKSAVPYLTERTEVRLRLASEFSEIAALDDAHVDDLVAHVEAVRAMAAGLEQAGENLRRQRETVDAIVIDPRLLREEAAIRDFILASLQGDEDRDALAREEATVRQADLRLQTLRRMIGKPSDCDLAALMPDHGKLTRLQSLAGTWRELAATRAEIDRQIGDLDRKLAMVRRQQAEAEKARFDRPLGFNAESLARLAEDAIDLESRRAEAAELGRRIEAGLSALGFEDIAALNALALPGPAELQTEIDARAALAREMDRQEEACVRAARKLDEVRTAMLQLSSGETLATKEAVAEARAERDQTVEAIGHLLFADPPEKAETRHEALARLRRAITTADVKVDQRLADSQRIAEYDVARRDEMLAARDVAALDAEMKRLRERVSEREKAFASTWPDACRRLASPQAMKAFLTDRDDLLALAAELSAGNERIAEATRRTAPKLERLEAAEARLGLTEASAGHSLSHRLADVSAAIKAHERDHADFLRRREALAKDEEERSALGRRSDALEREETNWRAAYAEALGEIGLSGDTPLAASSEIASEWQSASAMLQQMQTFRQAQQRREQHRARLDDVRQTLQERLELALPAEPGAAAKMLDERLSAALDARSRRTALMPGLEQCEAALKAAEARADAAGQALEAICRQLGCARQDAELFAEKALARRQLLRRNREINAALTHLIGDGFKPDGNETVAHALDDDLPLEGIEERLARLAQELQALTDEEEEAFIAVQSARSRLDAFSADDHFNAFVAAREAAATSLGDAAEQHLELALARDLLEEALRRIRREEQAPLLGHASQAFALATRGAYVAIESDVDDEGKPQVTGRRADGGLVSVSNMSSGTRDQMFLAFRIAGVERYCREAEPLPFLADDLLVHFDDERSAAALELLASLGRKTQVLLFTHHDMVREASRPLMERGLARLVEI
ncbi:hypothetical protein HDIA_4111 [Hartmannibacter diazotrophicus]|uniref:YhaN AAA domain-containing protein n=1 Tax=Hartmannibacter diazotrophicus TaxID=1482074 RepID=A0A2C9DBD9_9HYPH|nr:YhaN family protein [Hartmannibacter diazotrophicus]SON57652.1 hypothetical protein HDIA_4111 [Hartmannibacter diazotrophicus]